MSSRSWLQKFALHAAAAACLPLGSAQAQAPDLPARPGVDSSQEAGARHDSGEVEEVVVTASRTQRSRSQSPVATEVIGPLRIAASGAQNLADLLQNYPGLSLNRSGVFGAGIELGGLPSDYTLILVDGLRTVGRVGGVVDLARFPIEDIERVEIVRGAASALYGSDAVGGVVNIVTKRALRELSLRARAGAGAFGTRDASAQLGLAGRHASARTSVGYHASAGFDRDPTDAATTQGAIEQLNVSNTSQWTPNPDLELSGTAQYLYRQRDAIDASAGGGVLDRTNATETASVSVTPVWHLGESESLKLWAGFSLFRDQLRVDQRGGSAADTLQETTERAVQAGWQFSASAGRHRPVVGLELVHEHLRTPRLSTGEGTRLRGAAYAQDEIQLARPGAAGGGLWLVPSWRVDVDSQFGVYQTPRASLRYDPAPQVTARGSVGLGFKAPDFRELYLAFQNSGAGYRVDGNPRLAPERSVGADASLEFRPKRSLIFTLGAFFARLSERIATQLATGEPDAPSRFLYRNTGRARSRGLSAGVLFRPSRWLDAQLGHTLTLTRDEDTGQRLGGQPLHRATFSIRVRRPAWGAELFAEGALVGPRPFYLSAGSDGGSERTVAPAYASLDARLSQRVQPRVKVFGRAENLLDAGDSLYLPIQPRNFSAGVILDY